MPRFSVTVEIEVEVARGTLDAVDDGWRESFYDLRSDEAVAAHLAVNAMRGRRLSSLDGFADRPAEDLGILDVEIVGAERVR